MTDHPLRLHFVWTGRRFPYHCRLAIESAIVAMPDARIRLHLLGERPTGGHLDRVAARPEVQVEDRTPAEVFADCPGGPAPYVELLERVTSPAAVSNVVRLAVLHREGGVYLDTDVLVLRSLHDPAHHGSYVGLERVWAANRDRLAHGLGPGRAVRSIPWATCWAVGRLDVRITHGRLGWSDRFTADRHMRNQVNNAVIGSPPRSSFVALALRRALAADPTVRFALGPSLLDDVARAAPRTVHLVPSTRFYAVPPGQSHRYFEDHRLALPADAQVMHYVASNHPRLLAELDIDDSRFARGRAPFWQHARAVRAAIAEVAPTAEPRPTAEVRSTA